MMWTIYGGVGPGDTVLVNAIGGGVGLMCTQLAVHAGARASARPARRARKPKRWPIGASRVVVTSQEDFERAVLDFTGGKGVDLAIDSYGATMLDRTFGVVKMLGHVISIGEAEGSPSRTSASASCRAPRPLPACISAISTRHRPNGTKASTK